MADDVKNTEERKENGLDIIVLKPASPALAEIIKDKLSDQHNISYVASPGEAVQLAAQIDKSLLYICIANRKAVEQACQILLKLKVQIKQRQVKVVVMTKVINPQLRTMIAKLGITDYIEEPINVRSLFFKINLQLKAVKTQIDKDRRAAEDAKKQTVFKSGNDKNGRGEEKTIQFKRKPALQLGNDAFVFSGQPPQKKDSKYTVMFDGPCSTDGDWKKDEEPSESGQPRWKWTPKKPPPPKADGSEEPDVVFEGDKPQFIQSTGQWQLKAEKPELSLMLKKKKLGSKLSTSASGELELAEESPEAIELALRRKQQQAKTREVHDKTSRATERSPATPADLVVEKTESLIPVAADLQLTEAEDSTASFEPPSEAHKIKVGDDLKLQARNLSDSKAELFKAPGQEAINDTVLEFKSLAPGKLGAIDEENPLQLKKRKLAEAKKKSELAAAETAVNEEETDLNLKRGSGAKRRNNQTDAAETEGETPVEDDEIELSLQKRRAKAAAKAGEQITENSDEEFSDAQLNLKKRGLTKIKKLDRDGEQATEEVEDEAELQLRRRGERKQQKRKRGNEIIEQIHGLIEKPIKEDLTEQEAEEIEVELALPKKAFTAKRLAKKKRLKEIEALEEDFRNLGEDDDESEKAEREAKLYDLREERREISLDIIEREQDEASKINAIDSLDKAGEDGEDRVLAKGKGKNGFTAPSGGESGTEGFDPLSSSQQTDGFNEVPKVGIDPVPEDMYTKRPPHAKQEGDRHVLNERLAERIHKISPDLDNFLKKRKTSDITVTPDKIIAQKIEARFGRAMAPENALLGFKMALSDAIHCSKATLNLEKITQKVLQQGVLGIGFCALAVVNVADDSQGSVFASSDPVLAPGEPLDLAPYNTENGKTKLIQALRAAGSGQIIGYLVAVPVHRRQSFTEDEAAILARIVTLMESFWEFLYLQNQSNLRKAG